MAYQMLLLQLAEFCNTRSPIVCPCLKLQSFNESVPFEFQRQVAVLDDNEHDVKARTRYARKIYN